MDKEPDARVVYADIIGLPHWQSPVRPHMSLADRAAQFLAYKALTGFGDLIDEEARLTEEAPDIGSWEMEILNRKLLTLAQAAEASRRPEAAFTVFVPDGKKAGGRYEEVTDRVKKVDASAAVVVLETRDGKGGQNRTIPFENIVSVRGEAVDGLDGG